MLLVLCELLICCFSIVILNIEWRDNMATEKITITDQLRNNIIELLKELRSRLIIQATLAFVRVNYP